MNGRHESTIHVRVTSASADDAPRYLPQSKRRRSVGQQFAIQAFVGANGGGKTLAVVEQCVIPAWEAGRLVVSNMALYPEVLGFPADLAQPLTGWRDIVKMGRCLESDPCEPGECDHTVTAGRGCLLVLDEASAVLPSRSSGSVPAQLIRVLNQLRKRDVSLVWTAPAYARMDLAVRETTQAVTVCTGTFRDRFERQHDVGARRWFPAKARGDDGRPSKIQRGWAPNRLFTWVTYEAMSYDEFTLGKTAQLRPKAKRSYWRTRHQAMHAYKTNEGVEMLDHVDASGACMDCGLSRRVEKCSCSGPVDRPAPKGAERPEAVGGLVSRPNGSAREPLRPMRSGR